MCDTNTNQPTNEQPPTAEKPPETVDIMGSPPDAQEEGETPTLMAEIPPANIVDLPGIIMAAATVAAEETVRQLGIQPEQTTEVGGQQVELAPPEPEPETPQPPATTPIEAAVETPQPPQTEVTAEAVVATPPAEEAPVQEPTPPTPTEIIGEAVTAAHANMAEAVAAQVEISESTVSGKVVKHVTWQSSLQTILIAIVLLALLFTVIFFAVKQRIQETTKPVQEVQLEEKKIRTPVAQPDIYQKISSKFTQSIKKHVINEREITEKIGEVVFNSTKVEQLFKELFKETQQKLLEEGITNVNAVASTFLNDKIIAAVMDELPPEIKALPNAEGYVRIELGKYAANLSNELVQGL